MDKTVIVHDPESDDEHADGLPSTDEVKDNEDFAIHNDHWVTDRFIISTFLGRGKFGEVKKCTHMDSGEAYAAKFISTPTIQEKRDVEHEINIMRKLRHHLVLQLFSAYTAKTEMCLILELVSGGELFERIIDDDFILTERACVSFMRQTCRAMEYIHSRNIVHLDMKPENILCLTRLGTRIKVIDFGLAREVERGKELRVMFGTPEFMAPEVVNYELVDYATDMWSIGVICYVLLSGLSPFMGKNDAETLTNVIKAAYSFRYDDFQDISEDAKDLISNLLQKDRRKRLSATQCLQHSWLKRSPENISPTLHQSKKRLKRFVIRRKWQKVFNAIIALKRMGVSPASLVLHPPTLTNGVHSDGLPAQPHQRHQHIISEDKSSRHTPLSYKRRRMKKAGGAKDSSSGGSSSSHSRSAYTGEDQSSSGSSASESTTSTVSTPQSSLADIHKSPSAAPTIHTAAPPVAVPNATLTAVPTTIPATVPTTSDSKIAVKQELSSTVQSTPVLLSQKPGKDKVTATGTPNSNQEKNAVIGSKTDAVSGNSKKDIVGVKVDGSVTKQQPEGASVMLPQSTLDSKMAKMDNLAPGKRPAVQNNIKTGQTVADCYKSQLKPVGRKGLNGMSTLPRSGDTGSCSKQADTAATTSKTKDGKMTVRDNNWLSSKTNFIRLKFKETFL